MEVNELEKQVIENAEKAKWVYHLEEEGKGVFSRDCYCSLIGSVKAQLVDFFGATLVLSIGCPDCIGGANYYPIMALRDNFRLDRLYQNLEKEYTKSGRKERTNDVGMREMHKLRLEAVLKNMSHSFGARL